MGGGGGSAFDGEIPGFYILRVYFLFGGSYLESYNYVNPNEELLWSL